MTCPCREALERAARRCEELQVNRPSDPLANAFDGACRTCAREIRNLPPCGRCDGAWERFLENVRVMDGLKTTDMNFLGDAKRYRDAFERALLAAKEEGK